jgi:hypothetical protein
LPPVSPHRVAAQGLIDDDRIMVDSVVLGHGKPVLAGLANGVRLRLLNARTFANGHVLVTYVPG